MHLLMIRLMSPQTLHRRRGTHTTIAEAPAAASRLSALDQHRLMNRRLPGLLDSPVEASVAQMPRRLWAFLALGLTALTMTFAETRGPQEKRTIILQPDDVIPTNTPAFMEYALDTVLAKANLVARAWELEIPMPIQSNHVTWQFLRPKPEGASAGVQIHNRYGFGMQSGSFYTFKDLDYWISPSYDEEKLDRLPGMTNLLTLESAKALARLRLRQLGLDDEKLGLGEPVMARQWLYDSNDVIYRLPYFEVRWQTTNIYHVVHMGVSGVTSNLTEMRHNIAPQYLKGTRAEWLLVPMPTNYLEMLGLPSNVVFRPHNYESMQERRRLLLREAGLPDDLDSDD
jgi:hypothetical protein